MLISKNMHVNRIPIYIKIACFLNFLIFISFFTINYTSYGSLVMMGLGVCSVFVMALSDGKKIRLRWNKYYSFMLTFIVFSFLSCIWAIDPSDPIGKSITLLKCLLIVFMMMIAYERLSDVSVFLITILVAGYGVVIYSIFTYGLSTMRAVLLDSSRLDSTFANVNTVGMLAALSVVITIYLLLNKKIEWYCLIPTALCIYVIAATSSRKALVALILGVILVFLFYKDSNDMGKKISRLAITTIVVFLIYLILSRVSIFNGIMERMDGLINMFFGSGYIDRSARGRNTMIELGIEQFYKTPILGIGMGGGHQINYKEAYLHNNFIEVLVGGGLVGFCLYYSMYVYLLVSYMKYWKWRDDYSRVCVILLVLLLMLDYGCVSYAEKHTFFFQALLFMNVSHMKRRYIDGVNYHEYS